MGGNEGSRERQSHIHTEVGQIGGQKRTVKGREEKKVRLGSLGPWDSTVATGYP